jgi:hypothetical protein
MDEYCIWQRLPDLMDPLTSKRFQFNIGCIGETARGSLPVYPDVCPHCGKAVYAKSLPSAGEKP